MQQLTIFDIIEEKGKAAPNFPDFQLLELSEIARILSDAVGVTFRADRFGRYEAKHGKIVFDLGLSTYLVDDKFGQKFISIGYLDKSDHSGGGRPADSIAEAVNYYVGVLRKKEGRENGENI